MPRPHFLELLAREYPDGSISEIGEGKRVIKRRVSNSVERREKIIITAIREVEGGTKNGRGMLLEHSKSSMPLLELVSPRWRSDWSVEQISWLCSRTNKNLITDVHPHAAAVDA